MFNLKFFITGNVYFDHKVISLSSQNLYVFKQPLISACPKRT